MIRDMSTLPECEGLRCSFCNKRRSEVKKLIAGPLVFICNECVEVCIDILVDDGVEVSAPLRPDPEAKASRAMLADLMDDLTDLSVQDKWVMVRHLLARLEDQHVTLVVERRDVTQ